MRLNPAMAFLLPVLVPGLLSAAVALAADSDAGGASSDEAALAELLSIVEEETELATKSKMNADYVPGIVTIMHGEDLEALGVRTVWEALGLVPGIQVLADEAQSPNVLVRGFAFPFNSGNIKVLVDSVPANQEFSGLPVTALYLPIEVVQRIEVIRGPGSSIYGNAAFMGLVNVITRKEAQTVFSRVDDDDAWGLGGLASWQSPEGRLRMNATLAGWEDDSAGRLDEAHPFTDRHRSALVGLEYGSYALNAFGLRRDYSTSLAEPRPPSAPPEPTVDQNLWAIQLRNRRSLSPGLEAQTTISFLSDDYVGHTFRYRGSIAEGRFDLTWLGWTRQTWLAGVSYASSETDEAAEFMIRPSDGPGRPPTGNWREYGAPRRRLWSVWLQDQVAVNDKLTVTAGLRHDHFSDVDGNPLTPRLALVFRASERHILKAQYAEGFRAPTFWELYALGERDEALSAEVVGTAELSYVYRRPEAVARVTVFDSRLRDQIFRDDVTGPFENRAKASSRGAELEWTQQVSGWLKVDADLSFLDKVDMARNDSPSTAGSVASEWLGNLALLARPVQDVALGLRWQHVGDHEADIPEAQGYDSVDLTLSWFRPFSSNLTLRAGVRNLFDDEPVYLIQRPNMVSAYTYPGRTAWLQLSFGK